MFWAQYFGYKDLLSRFWWYRGLSFHRLSCNNLIVSSPSVLQFFSASCSRSTKIWCGSTSEKTTVLSLFSPFSNCGRRPQGQQVYYHVCLPITRDMVHSGFIFWVKRNVEYCACCSVELTGILDFFKCSFVLIK